MADIFLSHSSADNDAADKIKSRLEHDRESWSVFLDKHPHDGILAGQGWQERLRSELQSCRLVLALITPDWLASRWCFTEAVTATFHGKDFIGVLPGDLPDDTLDVAPPIVHERQRQRLDLATGAGWEEILHALDRSGLDPSHWFSIPAGVGPYPGFVAFEEKDAGVFFGRDQEITEYLDALNLLKASDRAQALVISGSSGSGKSSLLKAGLIPRLRQQPDWLIIPPFDPSREPIHALFSVVRAAGRATGADIDLPLKPPRTVEDLTEHLQDSFRAIEERANAWLLLPLDQAEVLLASSQKEGETDASRLLAAVGQLLATRTRKLVAVLTIRTEFMPALERALPSEVRLDDRPLHSITALSETIEKPAARFGIEIEEGLTGRMVEDTRGADALPLLAYTLRELNESYGADNRLTVAEYEQLGGVEGAIEKKLHQAFSDPKPTSEELTAFRRAFVRHFVRVDESAVEGERYLRTAVARDALPDGASRLVDRLREARLLVSGADGTISIAHERLIKDWTDVPLRTWLAEDRDDRKLIDNLNVFLVAYRDGGPLLSEKPLLDARDFLERDRALQEDEPELAQFIKDSVSAEQSRQHRQKWKFRGAVAASLVFLVVAIWAVWQTKVANTERDRAKEQSELAEKRRNEALLHQSRLLADRAQQAMDQGDPATGVLLALEALPDASSDEDIVRRRPHWAPAEVILENARRLLREQAILAGHRGPITTVAVMPGGARVVTGSHDKTVRIWHAETGAELAQLKHGDAVTAVAAAVTADGQQVISGSNDGIVRIWNLETGVEVVQIKGFVPVAAVAVTPDGARIITASRDGMLRVWDKASGEVLHTLKNRSAINAVAVTSDGTRFVSGSEDGTARLWEAEAGVELVPLTGHRDALTAVAMTPDGTRVVTASEDRTVRIWDAGTGAELGQLKGLVFPVTAVAVTPDGARIVTASSDGTARLWDANTGMELSQLTRPQSRVTAVAVTSDGARLVTGSEDGTARLWDAKIGPVLTQFNGHRGSIRSIAVMRDGTRIITGSADGTARIWDATMGTELMRLKDWSVTVLAVPSDGAHTFILSADGTMRVWDARTKAELAQLKDWGSVNAVAVTPDGAHIITGSSDGSGRVWDAAGGSGWLSSRAIRPPLLPWR